MEVEPRQAPECLRGGRRESERHASATRRGIWRHIRPLFERFPITLMRRRWGGAPIGSDVLFLAEKRACRLAAFGEGIFGAR